MVSRLNAVIMGDLTVDMAWRSPDNIPYRSATGADITLRGSVEATVGGSALYFAAAIVAAGHSCSLLVGAVGDDMMGIAAQKELLSRNLTPDGLQIAPDAPTCTVTLAILQDGTRLMLRPDDHAGRHISASSMADALRCVDPNGVDVVLLSGYCLLGSDTLTMKSAKELFGWAHRNEIPMVVDLVPHEFSKSVGDLEKVRNILGGVPRGYVCELRTARDLKMCSAYSDAVSAETQMQIAARNLAARATFAIVQHQIYPGRYCQQIVTRDGLFSKKTFHDFSPAERSGLGDRLLVSALDGDESLRDRVLHRSSGRAVEPNRA